MSKFERQTLTVDGVKTVVHTAGPGEPLVFFPGAMGWIMPLGFAYLWKDEIVVTPNEGEKN